ncbi:MAG: gamma-glutamyl-gamma-aminobutyrate hydrolase family protein [Marinifilaceae bacterium]|jgi:putative glutamine amidotransferase|nr:gamma-glutamyl-gamma-aminobutyrate hydrolase family protein [Marinifilaceae bacterium]
MKTLRFILIIVLIGKCINIHAEENTKIKDTLIIGHPTVSNLSILSSLNKHKKLRLENYHIIGIYNKEANYDYSKSEKCLDTLKKLDVSLFEFKNSVNESKLFTKNKWTKQFKSLFDKSVGIILFGGPDINPSIYGEKTHPNTKVEDPNRNKLELSFIYHVLGNKKQTENIFIEDNPYYMVFGICLGMQNINVATGGSLIQDIPDQVYNSDTKDKLKKYGQDNIHRNFIKDSDNLTKNQTGFRIHKIRFNKKFYENNMQIFKYINPQVYSYHHQAIKNLGNMLYPVAKSMDAKIIEAVKHKKYSNVFAVQFHPERRGIFVDINRIKFEEKQRVKYMKDWLEEDDLSFHNKLWKYINTILYRASNSKKVVNRLQETEM